MRRFFGRIEGQSAIIEGDELKHLSSVIRLKAGDKFVCICGDDFEYECEILNVDKKQATAKILKKTPAKANPKKNLVLFQALPKKEAFETIVQKACELGANLVQPFESEFVVNKSGINLSRYKAIISSACKQCERSRLMDINEPISFLQMLERLKDFDIILFANEIDGKPFEFEKITAKNIAVIVGCEGGFSENEKNEILKVDGVKSISLGSRILRADSASILLLGIASLLSGN